MPISETTVQNKANDPRPWLKLLIVGVTIIVLLGLVIFIYWMFRLRQTAGSGAIPQDSIAAINTSQPDTAVAQLNTSLTEALRDVDSSDPSAALTSVMNSLMGTNGTTNAAHIGLTYTMSGTESVSLNFEGDVQQTADNMLALQGSATIKARTAEVPDISVPVDLVIANQKVYVKVGTPTGNNLPEEYSYLGLLEGKWLMFDMTGLSEVASSNEEASEVLNESDRQEMLERWENNPPLINARATNDRQVGDYILTCMIADVNPAAFPEGEGEAQPMEICTANGNAPIYLGVQTEENGQNITFGLTVFSFGQPVTITAPTEDVVDFSSLLQQMSSAPAE